jgi:CheY-like chemotaxis protein
MHVPPRILIVHDNESNRDILVTRLATHGYDLCQAADGDRYSITSSALRRIDCGTERPSALAVLRLMTILNFVGS